MPIRDMILTSVSYKVSRILHHRLCCKPQYLPVAFGDLLSNLDSYRRKSEVSPSLSIRFDCLSAFIFIIALVHQNIFIIWGWVARPQLICIIQVFSPCRAGAAGQGVEFVPRGLNFLSCFSPFEFLCPWQSCLNSYFPSLRRGPLFLWNRV